MGTNTEFMLATLETKVISEKFYTHDTKKSEGLIYRTILF